ncbi:MAG: tetratricopeptide repeat protein [Sedimentisphaerales bacterium]|nr:tetratricopeptide repeat protein [Sedimentisphaerales bacterium]
MRRRGFFNWRLAAVLVLGLVVVGTTAVGLRQIQKAGRGQAALLAGKAAYERGDWLAAATNLGRYLSGHPDDVNALMLYADAQLNIRPQKPGNTNQAIAAYKNVLRVQNTNLEAARRLVEIYLAGGAPGEAELTARRFIQDNPNPHPQIQVMLGVALAQMGRFAEAVEQWQGVIDRDPSYIQAYEAIGRLAMQRPADVNMPAGHWFDLAVQRNPSSALARLARAGHYLATGRRAQAVEDLEAAQGMDLSDVQVRLRLAMQLIQAGLIEQARGHLEQAVKTNPQELGVWQLWAEVALRSGDIKMMAQVAEDGLANLKARSIDFMPQAAELFIHAGQLDRAAKCLGELKEKDILPPVTAYIEGLLESRKGRLPQAISAWHRALGLGFRSRQIRLLLANAYAQQGDMAAAADQLQVLCSEEPNVPGPYLALARHLARVGDWSGVRDRTRAALKVAPDAIEARLLELEAQIQLIAQAGRPADDPEWNLIESQLTGLESVPEISTYVRFMRLQTALARSDLAGARSIADAIEPASDEDRIRLAVFKAQILERLGQAREAEDILRDTVRQYPGQPQPLRALALLYLGRGQTAEAQKALEEGLPHMESPAAKRDLALLLTSIYDRSGAADRSVELLEGIARAEPNAIWPRIRLLGYQKVLSDQARAQALVDQIKSAEGQTGWQWHIAQARVWLASPEFKRYYPQLVSILRETIAARGADVEGWRLLAAAYEKAGELKLAISTYREALDRRPDDLGLVVAMVAALYRAQEYQKAEQVLQEAAKRSLVHPALDGLRFQGLMRLGQLDRAADLAEEVWTADPNNLHAALSLALLRSQQGQLDQAQQMLEQIHRTDPNWIPAASALARLYVRRGMAQQAMQICDRLVEARKDVPSLLVRAQVRMGLGQTEQAAADLDRAVQISSEDPEVWVARSSFLRASGLIQQALQDMDRALAIARDSTAVLGQALDLFLASGDPKRRAQARQMVEEAAKARPDDPQVQLLLVRFLLADGRGPSEAQADQILQQLTSNMPRLSEPWLLWAELLLNQANAGKALDVIFRGLAHHPNDRGLLRLKARAEASRSPMLALQTLRGLYELDPNDTDPVLELAGAYVSTGEPERAVALLDKHLKSCRPEDRPRCQASLAIALHRAGRKEEAARAVSVLAEAGQDRPIVLLTRSRLLALDQQWSALTDLARSWLDAHPNEISTITAMAAELGRRDESQAKQTALDILRLATEGRPNAARALMLLAQLYQQQGQDQEAAGLYRQILKTEPNNVVAMNNLAWILSESLGRPEEALGLANKGLGISADYLDLIDTRGVILFRLNRLEQAAEDLSKAVALYPLGYPAGVGARLHLAKVYAKQGKRQEAAGLLREALDLQDRLNALSSEELQEAKTLLEQMGR